mgnify:CR=1 FL=1
MKSFVEELDVWAVSIEESLKNQLEALPKTIVTRRRIGEIADELTEVIKPIYAWLGRRIEIKFETIEQGREFAAKLAEALGIEKVNKGFEGWKNEPSWYYEFDYEGQYVKIEPAEASVDCKPVPHSSSSVYWVCEKREEGE